MPDGPIGVSRATITQFRPDWCPMVRLVFLGLPVVNLDWTGTRWSGWCSSAYHFLIWIGLVPDIPVGVSCLNIGRFRSNWYEMVQLVFIYLPETDLGWMILVR